jgi:hypothetical protein
MSMLPSAQTPPCCRCGQPWEAHGCPRQSRGTGKIVVLAFLGGVATLVVFLLLAAYLFAGLTRPSMVIGVPLRPAPQGPLAPRLAACELFNKWEKTHDMNLLNRAVADAYSPRVPWPVKLKFSTEMSGLRSAARNMRYPQRLTILNNYEHAVQADCAPIMASYRSLWRREHRPHRSRPVHRSDSSVKGSSPRAPGAAASAP